MKWTYRVSTLMAPGIGIIQTGAITPMLPTDESDLERLPTELRQPRRRL
jgi:hypothetical protein